MRSFSTLILGVAALAVSAAAHSIQLHPHTRDCYHETLHREDRMTVSYQVGDREFGSAGNLEIDFWIQDPSGNLIENKKATSGGNADFEALLDGRYTYCFSNENSGSAKEVMFNVHGVVYVAEDPAQADPLEKGVKTLGELLNQVKDEQEYIVIREMVHRNTAESTNSRVKWWSIFQLGVVGGNGLFQVWYLKRFFEVKRVV
ncbi:emp24/gp25L/p24 family/GOLD-domain-containing protein [Tricharina praecox]|uniref:emp24/gp25L/p24 family/GOLD-domain-containing protein n=1 Tax=Tricharina praecox TaxID=43433 RepID=UPI0022205DAF|nr:emp24/gp25L/p24 family/GOLD-domain-containing protein [Tricharina praecox]KAI5857961.1 emp24/gp25L/p24 family/GOLD-domain-containing protein [Tricharina praecox]